MFKKFGLLGLLVLFITTHNLSAAENKKWTIVNPSGGADYLTIEAALKAGHKKIQLADGHYAANKTIRVANSGVELRGESKKGVVIEATQCIDLLHVDADQVTVSNLTLKQIPSCANTTFVTSDHDNITLKNTILYGSDRMFTVYFAGKKHKVGQQPLTMVETGDLNTGNRVIGNEIHSDYHGDVLSFSLQKHGLVEGNKLYGGMISLFLNRFVQCKNNHLIDPISQGIFVSLPSYNVTVSDNHIVGSRASGIKVANQIDHTDASGRSLTKISHRSTGITILNNQIEGSRFHGIEVQNLKDSLIMKNFIKNVDFNGVYVLRSDSLDIRNNAIVDATQVDAGVHRPIHAWNTSWDSAIYLEQYVTDTAVHSNMILTQEGRIRRGIAINPYWEGNKNNSIKGNILQGKFRYEVIHAGNRSTDVRENSYSE